MLVNSAIKRSVINPQDIKTMKRYFLRNGFEFRTIPPLTRSTTYKEGRLLAAWVLLVRKLIIHLRVVRPKKTKKTKTLFVNLPPQPSP